MKKGVHPEYEPATIVCSCGNQIETRSTQGEIHVEICAVCHPFYTGRQKLVDTAGRVERFQRKYGDTSLSAREVEEEEGGGEEEAATGAEASSEETAEESGEGGDDRAEEPTAAATASEDEEQEADEPEVSKTEAEAEA